MGAMRASEARSLKGSVLRPWKERDQSTGSPEEEVDGAEGRGSRVSERPVERERGVGVEVEDGVGCVDVGEDDCVCGALWTGVAGLGGEVVFAGGGFEVVAVDVAAVREVGRVRFTHRGDELEKYLGRALRNEDALLHGDDARTALLIRRRGNGQAILIVQSRM